MDYEAEDEFEEPFRIHLNLDNLSEEEAKARFSLLYDETGNTMTKRENTDYLRPIFIDGTDVSNRLNHMIRKNMELFPVDKGIFNIRSISTTLWYFISRGHSAVVYLPTNLRDFAQRCSDPHELSMLSKLDLIVFDESNNLHPSSSVLVSKSLASCAQDNDGCIVGSRKKYALLGQKYPEFLDRVTNSLISPSFSPDHELIIDDSVRLVLAADEVCRDESNANGMNFQLLATDQVIIMSKLARIIGKSEPKHGASTLIGRPLFTKVPRGTVGTASVFLIFITSDSGEIESSHSRRRHEDNQVGQQHCRGNSLQSVSIVSHIGSLICVERRKRVELFLDIGQVGQFHELVSKINRTTHLLNGSETHVKFLSEEQLQNQKTASSIKQSRQLAKLWNKHCSFFTSELSAHKLGQFIFPITKKTNNAFFQHTVLQLHLGQLCC